MLLIVNLSLAVQTNHGLKLESKAADKSVRPARLCAVLAQEAFAIFLVTERFCSSRASDGESARAVTAGQAGGEIGATEVFVQEASVEAIAGADCIDCRDIQRRAGEALRASLSQCSLCAQFCDHQRNHFRQPLDGGFHVTGSHDPGGLARVGK